MLFRYLANALLLLSIVPLLFINADNLCFNPPNVLYVSDMHSSNDDDLAFKLIALMTFMIGLILCFIKHKFVYIIIALILLIAMILSFYLIANSSTISMIMTSMIYCANYYLLAWLILLVLFLICVIAFIKTE